jgi:four helix bundle protein
MRRKMPPPFDFRERSLHFSKRVLNICEKLPKIPECDRIRGQLGASASSIGANYEEADASLTKKDLRNKLAIARKEAKETKFFLKLVHGTYLEELEDDIQEAEELVKILSSMIEKTR